uniref:Neur_chan_LBD domain-containing protein n=1 Tax=Caenorhabditis tropicalis TaxID=1561998 RepID=A0A1I7TC62_9PELO
MLRVILNVLLFLLVLTYDCGQNSEPETRIESNNVDVMPAFIQNDKKPNFGFVFNFHNLTYNNIPSYNYLAAKVVNDYKLKDGNMTTLVLPTLDYQAIYLFVYEGSVFVRIRMCKEGTIMKGGYATKGWNLIALDFPKLLRAGHCRNFSMDCDRPNLYIEGSAHFTLWKTEKFYFVEVPVSFTARIIARYMMLTVSFFAILFAVLDTYEKIFGRVKDNIVELSVAPPAYEKIIFSN